MDGPKLHLILLAAGQGLRAAGTQDVPKQFRPTGQGLLFAVSLREFLRLEAASGFRPTDMVLPVADSWAGSAAEELRDLDIPWAPAAAGSSRTASTWNALCELAVRFSPQPADLVAVHDAARPFASADLLNRLGLTARESGGAVPGIPVPDTIVQAGKGTAEYLERSSLYAVQTPQVFRWDQFYAAHAWAAEVGKDFTDDGGLMAARGHSPVVIPGEQGNWKVTTNGDWLRAESLLKRRP